MNAGSMGGNMWDIFRSADAMDKEGELLHFEKDAMQGAQYRRTPEFEHNIVLSATFCGTPGTPAAIEEKMQQFHEKRRVAQPQQPSAGCTFMNPTPALSAGKLISDLGLKGHTIGGAQVSELHANFIINTGTAKATDVTELIDFIRRRVKQERGIELKTEVQVVGEREPEF